MTTERKHLSKELVIEAIHKMGVVSPMTVDDFVTQVIANLPATIVSKPTTIVNWINMIEKKHKDLIPGLVKEKVEKVVMWSVTSSPVAEPVVVDEAPTPPEQGMAEPEGKDISEEEITDDNGSACETDTPTQQGPSVAEPVSLEEAASEETPVAEPEEPVGI